MPIHRVLTALAGSLLTTMALGCNAIVGNEPVQYRNELATEKAPAASACESSGHTQALNGDGGAPSTIQGQCATVVIDDTACAIDPSDVGLDLGLDTHGWAVTVSNLSCFGGARLTIQGVDDAPYPQTAVQPFLSEASASLVTRDDATDDAGVGVGPFSSDPSGSSTIEEGPTRSPKTRTVGKVRGSAEVVSKSGAMKSVVFEFSF